MTLKLNVAETDLVVVEDPSYLNSNAVILKVEKFNILTLFSCCILSRVHW